MLVRGSFRAQARSEFPIASDQEAETPSAIVRRLVHLHPARVGTADENEVVTAMLDWQVQVLELGVKGLWLVDFEQCDGYRYHGWTDPESAVLHRHSCKDEFAGRIEETFRPEGGPSMAGALVSESGRFGSYSWG